MTPYGCRDLGQHWFRYWLVAVRQQAITWTNVDLSLVRSSGIHLSAILQEILQLSVTEISLKSTYLNIFFSNLPGANELRCGWRTLIFIRASRDQFFSTLPDSLYWDLYCYLYGINRFWSPNYAYFIYVCVCLVRLELVNTKGRKSVMRKETS